MKDIKSVLKEMIPGKIRSSDRKYTEAEIEAMKQKLISQNSVCYFGCPICNGIGFYKDPDDGRVKPCPNADPLKLYPSGDRFGLDEDDRSLSWSSVFNFNNTMDAVTAIQSAMIDGSGWVYIWGPPGLGKTLALKIAVAESLRSGKQAAYARMVEIFDHLKGAYRKDAVSGESEARLDFWSDIPLLAIDEFDRINNTEWVDERRFLMMDRRYESALKRKTVTIMTSNTDPRGSSGYLFDRINDGRFSIIHVSGDSFRQGAEK